MQDIATPKDIIKLVNAFYDFAAQDSQIGHFFKHINWQKHKPRMCMFWEFALLEIPHPIGSIFDLHAKLPIKSIDFDHWIKLFDKTIDTNFKGPIANLAKQKAKIIAYTFNAKMNA